MSDEDFKIQMKDAFVIQELADWIRAEAFEKHQRGGDGKVEAQKVKEHARLAIKIVAEYL